MIEERTNTRGFQVRALGEIAIRCKDIGAMERFYGDVLGLEPLGARGGRVTFFKIAEGYAGHTSVLALFAADAEQRAVHPRGDMPPVTGGNSALHHIALSLGLEEQARAIAWYEEIGQPYRIEEFEWIGWRGVFTTDPEGNTVELVAATARGPAA